MLLSGGSFLRRGKCFFQEEVFRGMLFSSEKVGKGSVVFMWKCCFHDSMFSFCMKHFLLFLFVCLLFVSFFVLFFSVSVSLFLMEKRCFQSGFT